MDKMPKIEINSIPSQLNTEQPSGVASQLANVAADPPHYDGVTIQMMKGNPLYERIDDIDKRGRAIEALEMTAKTVHSNRGKIRKFNEISQKLQKPSARN